MNNENVFIGQIQEKITSTMVKLITVENLLLVKLKY